MSVSKCVFEPTTRLVFLGVICDSDLQRFEDPPDKLVKLEAILKAAISAWSISFATLEKLAGKCTGMSVAVPAAGLYTHHMYKQMANFRRTGGSKASTEISVATKSGLGSELERWLEVRGHMNGASWYEAAHHVLALTGATDASSRGWGGLVRGPGVDDFMAAGDSRAIGPGLTSTCRKPTPSGR